MALRATHRRLLTAGLLPALVLLATACGGDATEGTPTATDLQSFRYRLTIALEGTDAPFSLVQTGEVVLPDREHATQALDAGPVSTESERVTVGERQWLRGDLPWMDLMSPLDYLSGSGSAPALEGLDSTEESLDGMRTRRYALDGDDLQSLVGNADLTNPDGPLNATLWVSTDLGVPVRLEVVAGSSDSGDLRLTLEVYDVNAEDIQVPEPQAALHSPLGTAVGA